MSLDSANHIPYTTVTSLPADYFCLRVRLKNTNDMNVLV